MTSLYCIALTLCRLDMRQCTKAFGIVPVSAWPPYDCSPSGGCRSARSASCDSPAMYSGWARADKTTVDGVCDNAMDDRWVCQ